MKKALVTGGCGFIGSNLTKKLVELGSLKIVHEMPWYWKVVVAH